MGSAWTLHGRWSAVAPRSGRSGAAPLQFTVPGIPAMFAGDEIGASYEPYSNLTPIEWKDRYGLRPFYERLIELKHHLASLRSHDIDVLQASPDGAFAYIRPAFGDGPP